MNLATLAAALNAAGTTLSEAGALPALVVPDQPKTDQEGQGREIGIPRSRKSATCPVAALEAWLGLAMSPINSPCQNDRERI